MAASGLRCCLILAILQTRKEAHSMLQMLTKGHSLVVQTGQIVELDCEFQMDDFYLFDNPVVWRKIQNNEETQMNLMGNIQQPFVSEKRFKVSFLSRPPVHIFWLIINELSLEDSGKYTCEIHGPQNTCIGNVTHQISIEAGIDSLQLTNTNWTLDNASASSAVVVLHQKRSLIYVLDRPRTLRCVLVAEAEHDVRVFLGRREVTTQFDRGQTVTVSGRMGLRRMQYTIQLTNHLFQPQASDDGRKIKCSTYSQGGGTINTTSVRLIIHYAPKISCESNSAYTEERSVYLRCEIRSRPALTSLYWVINNDTTVSDEETVDEYYTLNMDRTDGVLETQLYISETKSESFRVYTIVAENVVGRNLGEATLTQKFRPTPPQVIAGKANLRSKGPGIRSYLLPASVANCRNFSLMALLPLTILVAAVNSDILNT